MGTEVTSAEAKKRGVGVPESVDEGTFRRGLALATSSAGGIFIPPALEWFLASTSRGQKPFESLGIEDLNRAEKVLALFVWGPVQTLLQARGNNEGTEDN